jgi:DNA-binding response OmpR family regulator
MEDEVGSVDTVLIVEQDSETRALVREIVLAAHNFRVIEAQDGPTALSVFLRVQPDLVLLALQLPGLSGRDMLVALKSQGYRGPLIVIAEADSSHSAIDAFRLGATDFITKPLREPEVLAAVDRSMATVRLRRERDSLADRLQFIHDELEGRERELDALREIGQAVTALDKLDTLMQHVLESAVTLTGADYAALLLRDEKSSQLRLHAGQNLPIFLADRQGEALTDELADLVMTTRDTLVADYDMLRQFNTGKGLYAAIYAPLAVQTAAVGVLVVGNHQHRADIPESSEQLVRALANYLAMAVVSLRLSQLLDRRSNAMKAAYHELRDRDAQRNQRLQAVLASLHRPLTTIEMEVIRVSKQVSGGQHPRETSQALIALSQQIRQLISNVTALAQRPDQVLAYHAPHNADQNTPQKAKPPSNA